MGLEDFKKRNPVTQAEGWMELISSIQSTNNIKINNDLDQIKTLDTTINATSDPNVIDNLVSVIQSDSTSYNKPITIAASSNVISNATNRKQNIEFYHKQIDDMSKKYVGAGGIKGIQDLDKNDFKFYDYDYISSELNKVRDFNNIFKDQDYNMDSYNNQNIRTSQLKDRIEQYEQKLLTGLEAVRGDNLITDNELIFVITGNLAGLKTARTSKLESLTKVKNANNGAIAAIKRNIASLRGAILKKSMGVEMSEEGMKLDWKEDFNMKDLVLATDKDLKLYEGLRNLYGKEYDSINSNSIELGKDDEGDLLLDKEEYINREIEVAMLTNPTVLIKSWDEELGGYEFNNQKIDLEIKKWGGTNLSGFDKESFESKEKSMYDTVFDVVKPETPNSIEELPLDLVSTDKGYYSQKTGKYYDRDKVDELLSNF